LNHWRFTRRDHPYAFAFRDFVIDPHGFASRLPYRPFRLAFSFSAAVDTVTNGRRCQPPTRG
jgi:hypothetical protein